MRPQPSVAGRCQADEALIFGLDLINQRTGRMDAHAGLVRRPIDSQVKT